MSAELSLSVDQLQAMVDQVQQTQKPRRVRLADDVVAVVMPEKLQHGRARSLRRPRRLLPGPAEPPRTFTLESAFGSVPTPPQAQGKSIEDIIDDAKEEHAERIRHE